MVPSKLQCLLLPLATSLFVPNGLHFTRNDKATGHSATSVLPYKTTWRQISDITAVRHMTLRKRQNNKMF